MSSLNPLKPFKHSFIAIAAVCVTVILLAGCKKNDASDQAADALDAVSLSYNTGAIIDNEASTSADAAGTASGSSTSASAGVSAASNPYGSATTTAAVTASGTDTTITITFDGSICHDGKTRSGKLILHFTGLYTGIYATHSLTITSDGYTVNGNQVIINKTVTYTPSNTLDHSQLSDSANFHVVANDSIIWADGSHSGWHTNRTRYWVKGNFTPRFPWDDAFKILGTDRGTAKDGTVYTASTSETNPLYIALACRYIEGGTVTLTNVSTAVTRVIDYGDPDPVTGKYECDDVATVTKNGVTKTITLP